jgi:arginine repressor
VEVKKKELEARLDEYSVLLNQATVSRNWLQDQFDNLERRHAELLHQHTELLRQQGQLLTEHVALIKERSA